MFSAVLSVVISYVNTSIIRLPVATNSNPHSAKYTLAEPTTLDQLALCVGEQEVEEVK